MRFQLGLRTFAVLALVIAATVLLANPGLGLPPSVGHH